MNSLKIIITAAGLLAGLAIMAPAQDRDRDRDRDRDFPEHVRRLVDRTQDDLKRASEFERRKGKEVVRYENAQRHLSDFDREMTRGHFDKDKLDTAIDDVKNVVEHNTLDPNERDALGRDLADLRGMREEHDRHS